MYKNLAAVDFNEDFYGYVSEGSEEEEEELYAASKLKPKSDDTKKVFVNNKDALNEKLNEFKNDFSWIERLDIVCAPAPIPPEMAIEIDEQEKRSALANAKPRAKAKVDELKRESLFHRQAQSAVLEGIKRLKSLGIPTIRPVDYFAEMAKTDEHMQKVREALVKKKTLQERIEKVRKIREQKKIDKQLQAEIRLKKQNEKKQMLNEVQKFRKGIRKDLDFLEENKAATKKQTPQNKPSKPSNRMKSAQMKRQYKDKKYGFGGRKKGSKRNTSDSTADFGGSRKSSHSKQMKNKRPGKSARQKQKNSKRRR